MKTWLLRISVALCVLACLATGGYWVWKHYYSADQFRSAVAEGIETGDFSKAERLKRWGADTEPWRKADSAEQLQAAITADDVPQVHFLIRYGAPVETDIVFSHFPSILEVARGDKPLHWAVYRGHRDIAELLLSHGANVEAKNNDGWTSLHWAVGVGDLDIAKLLLAHGADPNAKTEKGHSPLTLWPGLADIVKEVEAEKAANGAAP